MKKPQIDQLVETAGVQLASRFTRRGFLGRTVSLAGAVMLGGAVILGERTESLADTLPTECYGTQDVNVCYNPWKCVRAQSGLAGIVMRKGPSLSAPPLYRGDYTATTITVGEYFGVMSWRNGGVTAGCPNPGARASVNGFVWGYKYGNNQMIGWIPANVNGITYSQSDNGYSSYTCGPAYPNGADYDCRDSDQDLTTRKAHCPNSHGCGGSAPPATTCSGVTYRQVLSLGDLYKDCTQRFFLRWGADSTAFCWGVPNDTFKEYCRTSSTYSSYYWSCVEGYCSSWAPNGCRGWIRSDALGNAITQPSACYPVIPCPVANDSEAVITVPDLATALQQADQASVKITGPLLVTTKFSVPNGLFYYVQQQDGSCGLQLRTSAAFTVGSLVTLNAPVQFNIGPYGRYATFVEDPNNPPSAGVGPDPMRPLYMTNKTLAGAAQGLTPGATDGTGVNNTGLYVATTGKVTYNGTRTTNYDGFYTFYVDDGSGVANDTTYAGVKIYYLTQDFDVDTTVRVTGNAAIQKDATGNWFRVIFADSVTAI